MKIPSKKNPAQRKRGGAGESEVRRMKKFKKLRSRIFDFEFLQEDLAKRLGKSTTYLKNRLNGSQPFTLQDAYLLCDLLEIEMSEIPKYFPREEFMVKRT